MLIINKCSYDNSVALKHQLTDEHAVLAATDAGISQVPTEELSLTLRPCIINPLNLMLSLSVPGTFKLLKVTTYETYKDT